MTAAQNVTLYAVRSLVQKRTANGYHFVSRSLDRAVTEAIVIAKKRRTRMYVVIVRR